MIHLHGVQLKWKKMLKKRNDPVGNSIILNETAGAD